MNKVNDNEEFDQVTLVLDDDSELVCDVISIFPVNINNVEQMYIAVIPEDAGPDGEIFLYRYVEHGSDEDIELINIEDDDEFEAVSDAFDELLDAEEFDEMFDDEEDEDE